MQFTRAKLSEMIVQVYGVTQKSCQNDVMKLGDLELNACINSCHSIHAILSTVMKCSIFLMKF